MWQGHVAGTNPIVWKLNFHENSCCGDEILSARRVLWIQISLNWGDMSRRQNNVTPWLHTRSPRVNCSCNMSLWHFRKISQSENEITICPCNKTLRANTSRNLSPPHAPSCEQRMQFFPVTSLQHVPSCVPTFTVSPTFELNTFTVYSWVNFLLPKLSREDKRVTIRKGTLFTCKQAKKIPCQGSKWRPT